MPTALRRRTVVTCVAVGAVLGIAPGLAVAAPVGCGATITHDTVLSGDLTGCPASGLIVGADNITIDLRGHTIASAALPAELDFVPDSIFGIDNLAGHRGVTIKNGTVRGFSAGIALLQAVDNRLIKLTVTANRLPGIALIASDGNRLQQITASGNGVGTDFAGILMAVSNHNEIINSTLSGNADAGVFMPQSSDNTIEHNTISANTNMGIESDAADRNTVSHNRVFSNGDDIQISGHDNTITDNEVSDAIGCGTDCGGFGITIEGGERNLIARNTVTGALRDGIRVAAFDPAAPTANTIVRDNHVTAATGDGISVATEGDGTVTGTQVERNTVIGSGRDGFDIRAASSTLTANLALHNGAFGIEAIAGVIDGGHNRAFANASTPQCTTVACR